MDDPKACCIYELCTHESPILGLGCQSGFVLECPIRRPEGPKVNRPGRKAGNKAACEMRAEGAAHNEILEYRAFSAHSVVRLFPGLTAGPINFRPFGPQIVKANFDKPGLKPGPTCPFALSLLDIDFFSRPSQQNM
jgi:hypothetical protein